MKYSDYKRILKQHDLRVTDCRMDVLEYFMNKSSASSVKDLESEFEEYDRVTLYRTLQSFTDSGVLHRIPDDSGFATYGVCREDCGPNHHKHDHMHFKCVECGNIECLSEKHLPSVSVPGYLVQEVNMILSGVCSDCQ